MKRGSRKSIGVSLLDPSVLLVGLSAMLLWYLSVVVLRYYAGALVAPGPNTIGEAGKVYFAHRFATGGSIFETGIESPYYPSVHGAFVHALPGLVGAISGVDTTTLYYIGRALSVGFTLAAFFVTIRILDELRLSRFWIIGVVLLLFADRHISIHTVSYRPDNWLLFYSAASCLLIMKGTDNLGSKLALGVLPVLAFFTKATGLSLIVSITLALLIMRRARTAWQVGMAAVLLILVVGFGLQIISEGSFFGAFFSGASMGFSVWGSLRLFRDPLILFVTLSPLLLLRGYRDRWAPRENSISVLVIFWTVGLLSAAVAATRNGSNFTYLLEPYYLGSVLLVIWLNLSLSPARPRLRRLASSVFVFCACFMGFATHVSFSGKPNIALFETRLYGDERQLAANTANRQGEFVYSSDPGLNVLLNRPAVIHPYVQTSLIRGRRLSQQSLFGPVIACEYTRIYLIPETEENHGIVRLPPEFFRTVEDSYMMVPYDGDYQVFEPIQARCPKGS